MRFHELFDKLRRSFHHGRPRRALGSRRRAKLFLEEMETRIVPSGLPAPPTGLAVEIQNDTSQATQVDYDSVFVPLLNKIKDPNISGVAFQIDWKDIEPNMPDPTQPDDGLKWQRIHDVFQAANDAGGKWVQLLIFPGFWSPDWVTKSDTVPGAPYVQTAQFQVQYGHQDAHPKQTLPLPLPYDPHYLKDWSDFLDLLSAKFENNPAFQMIAAAGPTSVSDEVTEPSKEIGPNGTIKNPWVNDPNLDYTSFAYVNAWQQVFDVYHNDFKQQYVSLSHGNGLPTDSTTDPDTPTIDQIVTEGSGTLKHQFAYQSSALRGTSHHESAILSVIAMNGSAVTGFQIGISAQQSAGGLGASGNSPLALTLAIENGMQLNQNGQHANYIEVHSEDVDVVPANPTDPEEIAEAAAMEQVLSWGKSLFDPGKISLFDQDARKNHRIDIGTDGNGNATATMKTVVLNGGVLTGVTEVITIPKRQITSIDIYPAVYLDSTATVDVRNVISQTNVPVTLADLPAIDFVPAGYLGFNPTDDAIMIGDADHRVRDINGTINVISSNPSALNIDDSGDKKAQTVTVTRSSVTGLAPAPIDYTGDGLTALNIETGKGFDQVDILSTSAGDGQSVSNSLITSIIGNGPGMVNVGDGGSVQGIKGKLAFTNDLSSDNDFWDLFIDDSADKRAKTVTVTSESIEGLAPAPIAYEVDRSAQQPVKINGGSGGNTFTIESIPDQSINLNTGSGNDTVFVPASGVIDGHGEDSLVVNGQGGTNTLVGPDADNTWNITGRNSGTIRSSRFSSFQNLTGGSGKDTFVFGLGASVAGTIDGGTGANRLDYSSRRNGVYVNMVTGEATATGGIANIREVYGSGQSDLLVGNGRGVLLVETTGRNLMIGGTGGDATLMSGSGADIVIAGWTKYDDQSGGSTLLEIESFWSSGVTDLSSFLHAKTVHHHDGPGDTIVLGSANDWLFWRMDGENKLKGVAGKTTLI